MTPWLVWDIYIREEGVQKNRNSRTTRPSLQYRTPEAAAVSRLVVSDRIEKWYVNEMKETA